MGMTMMIALAAALEEAVEVVVATPVATGMTMMTAAALAAVKLRFPL
jgi:hypothetical protein